jgi:hypothetical protein
LIDCFVQIILLVVFVDVELSAQILVFDNAVTRGLVGGELPPFAVRANILVVVASVICISIIIIIFMQEKVEVLVCVRWVGSKTRGLLPLDIEFILALTLALTASAAATAATRARTIRRAVRLNANVHVGIDPISDLD